MIRAATHVTDVAISCAESGFGAKLAWRLGPGDCSPSVPRPLFGEHKHDAVSIGLAALDGTVSSRWRVTVPRSACGWRDAASAIGAPVAGVVADLLGLAAAI